ncbi:MAG: NfeD family protein [Calditrichia bacterium]
MIKNILIAVVIIYAFWELLEHVILPLFGAGLGKKRKPVSGAEGMIGRTVEVREWKGTKGTVFINGEFWKAESDHTFSPGDKAVIRELNGLKLKISPVTEER